MFGKSARRGRLEIDTTGTSSDSAAIRRRLDRIADHYERLDIILDQLEQKLAVRESALVKDSDKLPRKPR